MRFDIISTGRPEVIRDRTVKTLRDGGVADDLITAWVATPDEVADYRRSLGSRVAVEVAPSSPKTDGLGKVGIEPVSVAKAHNFVMENALEIGDWTVFMDDDVELLWADGPPNGLHHETKLVPLPGGVEAHVREMIEWLDGNGLTLGGVNSKDNPYFLNQKIQVGLYQTIGNYVIVRKTGTPADYQYTDMKDDYERSIRHYCLRGGVLRDNRICTRQAYARTPGGLQQTPDREALQQEAVKYMLARYPMYVRRNKKKTEPSGIRLHDYRPKEQKGTPDLDTLFRQWPPNKTQ